jgi:hypothetical protein
VTPDPSNPVAQAAFKEGALKQLDRHSRPGFIDEERFLAECARLRGLGFKHYAEDGGRWRA